MLVEGDTTLRSKLAAEISRHRKVEAIDEPGEVLVMVRVRETAQRSLFYLGEVLVSEARVKVAGAQGIGIIAGNAPESARELAIVDAAYNAGLTETEGWEEALKLERRRIDERRREREQELLETRVRFETMDGDS